MSTFINSPKTVDQLREEYDNASEKARRYKNANFIFDFPEDADIYYLKLIREKYLKYMDFKKAELSEKQYNKFIRPVYSKKLRDVELFLRERGVSV